MVHEIFQFEGYTLDVTRGSLRAGDREVELRPKSFEVLRYLVENASRLVPKEELFGAIWPGIFVGDDSLARCVSEVRSALRDEHQRIIKTVPRRGYLFAATVSQPKPAALPLPDRPSIAVLPFSNLSGDPEQDYFSDGVSEDVITGLSKFRDLFVIAHHSASNYKGQQFDAKQIGSELGVRYLLVGSVRRGTARLRITVQLVDANTAHQLWAEHYDREPTDIFAVQDEVTQKIVVTLVTHVAKSELVRALRKPPHTLAAYDYYLRGNALMKTMQRDKRGQTIATIRALYQEALNADPNYALAMHALANTYFSGWIEPTAHEPIAREYRDQSVLDHALSVVQRAVELDETLPEAHATLAWILHWQYRREESLAEYALAFELNPNLADGRFGHVLSQNGRNAEAIDFLKRVMRLDPFHPPLYLMYLGSAYYLDGRYQEAFEVLRAAARRLPGFRPVHVWRAAASARLDRSEEAMEAAAEVLRLQPDFTISEFLLLTRHAKQEHAERLAEGLRKAGLP
ncbi:winged helix-turn-helix domain-containing protein [Bradyrhizobium erythrophlei]|uniref:winged helix-turn-helix domain-containing protein n=1 Tax=Bradyrhizobium erythrophlei TaxID=1437360 RepID=UPI0035EF603A